MEKKRNKEWIELNKGIKYLKEPIFKSEGKYMALCIDHKSNNPYNGIARKVVERKGSLKTPNFLDKSKLVRVKSPDLINWEIEDLEIEGINKIVNDIIKKGEKEEGYLGLEDPDIININTSSDSKNSKKHVYFTIPFKYHSGKYGIYLGHAEGPDLDNLKATSPVLGKLDERLIGFKEVCLVPSDSKEKTILTETYIGENGKRKYYGIGLSKAKDLGKKWNYQGLVHNPNKETKKWCSGYSSPCRFFNSEELKYNKYLVGIMNGRESSSFKNNKEFYGKFRPGLFLFDRERGEIVWVDNKPLLEDPKAENITFASELYIKNKDNAILYCHIDDSFIRPYKINLGKIEERIDRKFNN